MLNLKQKIRIKSVLRSIISIKDSSFRNIIFKKDFKYHKVILVFNTNIFESIQNSLKIDSISIIKPNYKFNDEKINSFSKKLSILVTQLNTQLIVKIILFREILV